MELLRVTIDELIRSCWRKQIISIVFIHIFLIEGKVNFLMLLHFIYSYSPSFGRCSKQERKRKQPSLDISQHWWRGEICSFRLRRVLLQFVTRDYLDYLKPPTCIVFFSQQIRIYGIGNCVVVIDSCFVVKDFGHFWWNHSLGRKPCRKISGT